MSLLVVILIISGFIVLQIALIFFFFYRRSLEIIFKKRRRQVVMFLSVQLIFVFLVLLGSFVEYRGKFFSHFRWIAGNYIYQLSEDFEAEGDPGLVKWVYKQRPILPRPEFTDAESFRAWQKSLRHILLDTFDMSDIATQADVNFHVISSKMVDETVKRTFLTFKSFDGTAIPAYLFTPTFKGRKPAVVVLHGHVDVYEDGISQTAGLVDSYQNKAALELAKAGYVTLTIEFRGFGYLGPKINTEHIIVAYNAILGGSFYKAIISKDIKYAIDLLQTLDYVDPMRIGITGVSFGGEMAVTYASIDERIKVIVFQAFGGQSGIRKGALGKNIYQYQIDFCNIIPGVNTYLLKEDMFLLIAPRPLLGVRGEREYVGNAAAFSEIVQKAYNALDAPSFFRFEIVPGAHEFLINPAIQFFNQYL